jgi:hypothetical protein
MRKYLPVSERPGALKITLSPTQREAADGALLGLRRADCAVVRDLGSDGKTTVLEYVHSEMGGSRIGIREFLSKLNQYEPSAMEEAFLDLMEAEMDKHDLVLVDDLHLITNVVESCDYNRKGLFDAVLTATLTHAAAAGKKLLFATGDMPYPLARRAHASTIGNLTSEDFEVICSAYLDPIATRELDFVEIHRFAPNLNAHQLRKAAVWLSHERRITTAAFCEYLSANDLVSNVTIEEVDAVTWDDLKGVDDLIQALEAKIALPLENRELAAELNLKPKRGVLLAGPPGTGKTTIGRALAHRLKGKCSATRMWRGLSPRAAA